MQQIIEAAIETTDGIVDCRLELTDEGNHKYSATILYPCIVDGFSRSQIYTCDIRKGNTSWHFEAGEDGLHPKVMRLEQELSSVIINANR